LRSPTMTKFGNGMAFLVNLVSNRVAL